MFVVAYYADLLAPRCLESQSNDTYQKRREIQFAPDFQHCRDVLEDLCNMIFDPDCLQDPYNWMELAVVHQDFLNHWNDVSTWA